MEIDMSILAKLELTSVKKNSNSNPIETRRERLIEKLNEQIEVFKALKSGKEYTKTKRQTVFDDEGNRQTQEVEQKVKAWFFEQDSGWYVQCRYGSRLLNIYHRHNAVFVKNFNDVGEVLSKFIQATKDGELDKSIASVLVKRK